jgi:hypothetical protein
MRVTPPHYGRPPLGRKGAVMTVGLLERGSRAGRPTAAECPQAGPSAGVVVVLVRLLFEELNEVAACVVKDGHDSGADVGRRLRDYDAVATAVPRFNSDEAFSDRMSTLSGVTIKARFDGHEFDLQDLADWLPSGNIRVMKDDVGTTCPQRSSTTRRRGRPSTRWRRTCCPSSTASAA